jgi:VWFA-related protein
MTCGRALVLAFLAAALSVAGIAGAAEQRSDRERSLYVSVLDQNGAPVSDISTSDIVVREDNVAREVLRIVPADDPMHIAVLVDTSLAATPDISYMRQALPPFAAEMTKPTASGRRSEIAVIGLGDRPTILSEYSSDPAQIKKGVDRIWAMPGSGMYLLDAIVDAAKGFKKREAQRPVIVAIATSGVEYSNRHHEQVLDSLKDAGVAFYALILGPPDTGMSIESRERAITLDDGTRLTGGSFDQVLASLGLPDRLRQLADVLTHQYKVTYSRPESLIPPEKITVTATKPGFVARGTPIKEAQVRK